MEGPVCPGCLAAQARIPEVEAKVLELQGQLRDLLDTLQPPPQHPVSPPLPTGPAKTPTGRRPGGQEGHAPLLKKRMPAERLHRAVPYVPTHCRRCRQPLPAQRGPADPEPTWHQLTELPEVAAEITEYQGHYRSCPCCGESNPADVRAHSAGPRLSATLSYLAGCHGVSKRGLAEIAEALFAVPLALGTIANLEQETSAVLAPCHEQALRAVAAADVKHIDETGWKQAGKKRWLRVVATVTLAAFLISPWRNLQALQRLLGRKLMGILCSDRWRVYGEWPQRRRQVCWAHLKRNWDKQAERGGAGRRIAEGCLDAHRRVFHLWHLYRGGCDAAAFDDGVVQLMFELRELLRAGRRSQDGTVARFCARLLAVYPALWTFAVVEGVEATNNHADRLLRRAVLWRWRSFGCQSSAGCRFVERILTAMQSLRLQGS
jgi:transposase